jgi:DNA replicative helicase MCM subunit Mcm2 (Cdc46/Mcm family)
LIPVSKFPKSIKSTTFEIIAPSRIKFCTLIGKMIKYPSKPINFIKLAASNPQEALNLLQDPDAILYDLPSFLILTQVPGTSRNQTTIGFRGKIVRCQKPKILETFKLFTCNKCNAEIKVDYDPILYNQIIKPRKCIGDSRNGTKFIQVDLLKIIKKS